MVMKPIGKMTQPRVQDRSPTVCAAEAGCIATVMALSTRVTSPKLKIKTVALRSNRWLLEFYIQDV